MYRQGQKARSHLTRCWNTRFGVGAMEEISRQGQKVSAPHQIPDSSTVHVGVGQCCRAIDEESPALQAENGARNSH